MEPSRLLVLFSRKNFLFAWAWELSTLAVSEWSDDLKDESDCGCPPIDQQVILIGTYQVELGNMGSQLVQVARQHDEEALDKSQQLDDAKEALHRKAARP